ncbi:MAG TPA: hypothetical protein VIK32_02815 [Candidatus Limnocylindrales bacterium]
MARAKRTDRAEARRQYRAYLQEKQETAAAEANDSDGAADVASSRPARSRDQRPQAVIKPGGRLGIFAAAKAAYRTPHYLDDIRNVRSLVFHSKAVWPVLVVCVAAGAFSVFRISSGAASTDPVLTALFQFLFYPVPLVPPMLAGFLAPRSTWLAGLIAGFISTMTMVGFFAMTTTTIPGYAGTISGGLLAITVQMLSTSLAFGLMMAALSGWYKRFLSLTSAPRNRAPAKSASQRPTQRRRPTTRG